LQRFASVGKGDPIQILGKNGARGIVVPCLNGEARVAPAFTSTVHIAGMSRPVHVSEIQTGEEFAAYERLASYHHRNHPGLGRKSVLIAKIGAGRSRRFVGYIELTNTFSGHGARNALLDAPFASGPIKWDRWDLGAKKKYLNSIARISRCVVHPEYRGIGLGT